MTVTLSDMAARHLASIVSSSEDAIVSKNLDGIVLSWNSAAERMFGYTAAEAVGRSIRLIVPDDRQSEEDEVLARVRAGESTAHFETIRKRKDGSAIEISLTVSPIRDEAGNVIGASKIARDISERKHLQAALVTAEDQRADLHRRLLTLVAASQSLIGTPDLSAVLHATINLGRELIAADGYAIWRAQEDGLTWKPEVFHGLSESFMTPIPADDYSRLPFTEPLVIADVQRLALVAHRRDAYTRERIAAMLVLPLRIRNELHGTFTFYYRQPHVSSEVDIQTAQALANVVSGAITTAELFAERDYSTARARFLANASERLSGSLDYHATLTTVAELAVPRIADWCGVDIVDRDDKVIRLAVAHVNPERVALAKEMQRRYPDNPDEPGSIAWVIKTGQPALFPDVTDAMLAAGTHGDVERLAMIRTLGLSSYMCAPLKTARAVIGAIAFASSESGRHFGADDLAFAQELASRAAIAIENARAYEDTQRANRIKDDFLATLSHELRTPLNAILGYTRMLRVGSTEGPRREHALSAVERNAKVLSEIVADVLDVSRMVSGKLVMEPEPLSLRDVVEHSVESVAPAAADKEVALEVRVAGEGGFEILGDRARLQQVFWNLLGNAIKFTPARGTIEVTVTEDGTYRQVLVRDSGLGIPAEFLARIFQPFQQADTRTNRSTGGLGLGLAISKAIVEMHGGSIAAASDGEGRGSTFTVRLPIAPSRMKL